MFKCQECGRKFKTAKAAQRASNNGCPGCGGVDIDLDVPRPAAPLDPTMARIAERGLVDQPRTPRGPYTGDM